MLDTNFVAEPGQFNGVYCSTGSGKSTDNLIPRFYDVSVNRSCDGVDRSLKLEDLSGQIGYVPQGAVCGTVITILNTSSAEWRQVG